MRTEALLPAFLWIARLEGLSLIVLFAVAMPLKYGAGWEHATLIPGSVHGGLFLAYVAALGMLARRQAWPATTLALGLLASLLPFGTFVFEWRWIPRPSA